MKLRKFLPLIAVLLLMLVAIPLMVVSASAEEAELTPSEGLTYQLNGKKTFYTVTGIGDFEGTDLVIPSTYNGLPVQIIGKYAFQNETQLTSVYIPDSVTTIGHAAFMGCSNLTTARTSANAAVASYMFNACKKLTSVVIPEGVKQINSNAFRDCSALASAPLPSTLESIRVCAFRNCRALTEVIIPEGVTYIDHGVFYGCAQLRTLSVPGTLETIPTYFAYNNQNLRNLTIADGVKTISPNAFEDCKFLKSVVIPDSVTSIGNYAFRGDVRLVDVTLSNDLTTMGKNVFARCEALTSIVIPESLTTIGQNCFTGCTAFATVFYAGDAASWAANTAISEYPIFKQKACYTYSENDPQAEGFWHYVNGVPTVWEVAVAKEFTVTFNANGQGTAPEAQTVVEGATATEPAAPTATGYTFGGWYTDAACTQAYDFAAAVEADITLYAKWTVVTFTVTFDANGQGTAPAAQTVEYGKTATAPEALVATGYTFGGWYTDAACTEAYDFGAVTADVTVYAKWTVVTFTVTFDANGQGTAPAAQTVEYGKTATAPEALVATGYTFGGWYTDAACTTAYDFGAVTADVTVYAKWTVNTFTVTFNANGKGTAPAAQTVEYGKTATAPTAPTAEGFDFDGWYTDADCTVAYDFDAAVTANVTLYAKWSVADDVVIGGDPDDGDLEMPEIGI